MEIDVKHIAKLAKLDIPEAELGKMEKELTSKESLLDPQNTMQLRPDEVKPSFPREEMLKNVPETAAGCLMVPKVVE